MSGGAEARTQYLGAIINDTTSVVRYLVLVLAGLKLILYVLKKETTADLKTVLLRAEAEEEREVENIFTEDESTSTMLDESENGVY
ncbi:unnamed protein product [Didymodactylos carnosus]|uniref:Uncharacterized protein n=1 Tax=Didymodactylos carnosus TaxID=1234261 RepID=A0A8S2D5E2_9BILA|nr:unnamed protein product [Didymodactylos carnosus]CAF3666439.1 unnamed protein product [Didymodactylos carnosus]